MKIGRKIKSAESPDQASRGRTRETRILFAAVLLALFASVAVPSGLLTKVSAAMQNGKKRAGAAAAKSPKAVKPAPGVRQSKAAQVISESVTNPDGTITPGKIITDQPVQRTMAEIMADQAVARPVPAELKRRPEFEGPEEKRVPQDSKAIEAAQWPLPTGNRPAPELSAPQTLGTQFDGATGPTETGAFPPDTMGAVGPTQFFVFINGRMRTFNKTTGTADGVVNADPDVFFASVLTPPGANEVVFTSDPNVRYDRLTGRWYLTIIDVPLNLITGLARANRVLIAVSDAASSNALTGGTVWTFYQFNGDGAGTRFTDYPSLGIDANALYIGADMFSATTGGFSNTRALIIPKAPTLTGAAITVFAANNLITATAGPFAPRGVDNPDPANTGMTATGYFIGVDALDFSELAIRRVTNPGAVGGAPSISANITVTTPLATNFDFNTGQSVPHLGNTVLADSDGNGYPDGNLDALDDRLYAAVIRNGRLWTAHNIGVNSAGVATPNAASNTAANDRVASRWYELQNLGTTPSVLQSGTVFDNAAANPRHYWIPSIAVSGQGHAALGSSIAGNLERVNAFTTGRLVGDTLGTLRDGSPGAPPGYTSTALAYNPPGDPGPNRRWGDYSFTSLDPKDDMTMWTIEEYCNGLNTYGVRAVKLIAPPPPPTNTANPAAIQLNNPSTLVVVTGLAPAGQGYYDPGANPAAPHTPFNHISASGAGIIVNSITFNTPTQVSINVSTVGSTPGSKTITITNPDGQTTTVQILVGPTAVKLDSFAATGFNDGRVLVQWKSGQEADNLGFNVYREQNGSRIRITPQLVAGSALIAGANAALTAGKSYNWVDTPQAGGKSVRYWLEEVDLKGNRTLHGPVDINYSPGRAPTESQSGLLTRFGAHQSQLTLGVGSVPASRRGELARTTAGPQSDNQTSLAGQAAVKINVRQEGWYRVTQPELLAAGLSPTTDPRLLQLYVDGQQMPISVIGDNSGRLNPSVAVDFYGIGLDTPSTDTRTYWLVAGTQPGKRIGVSPIRTSIVGGAASFTYSVERKDRTLYFSALRNGDAENFFGPVVSTEAVVQALSLQRLAPGAAQLEVALQGVTFADHRVRVLLNGVEAGSVTFKDQGSGVGTFQVSQSQLREGENQVSLVALGGQPDVSLINYVRITYQHAYTADNNALRLTATGGQTVTIDGFSGAQIRVMDVTDPAAVMEVTGTIRRQKVGNGITFNAPGEGTRSLLAFDASQVKQAARTAANIPSSLRSTGNGADLLIITHRDFFAALEPLAALRRSQGLAVTVVDYEDVRDEFSYGHKTPQALKDFVSYAGTSWKRAPRYVLLAGDASFDARNYLGFGDYDIVPTLLIDTELMETASDATIGDLTGDGVEEIAIGRLPVRTAQEASRMVSKIIGYEKASASETLLLASDLDDGGFSFARYNNDLRSLVPGNIKVESVTRGADIAASRRELIDAINRGQKIVNYMGHGNTDQWKANLLTSADAASLTNGDKLSLFVMMTCLNGYFQEPSMDGLAESLMRAERGGAIAVWASTGLTSPGGQIVMNQEAYRLLFDGTLTLGEATRRAKAAVNDADVRRTWVLLGDPSMKLR